MNTNPVKGLITSRRFWLLIMDAVTSVILHYFAGPDAQFLIAVLQPVVLAVIVAFTVDDAQRTKAEAAVTSARLQVEWQREANRNLAAEHERQMQRVAKEYHAAGIEEGKKKEREAVAFREARAAAAANSAPPAK